MYKSINKWIVSLGVVCLMASFCFVAQAQTQVEVTTISANSTVTPIQEHGGLTLVSMGVVLAVLALMSIIYIIIGSVISGSYFKKKVGSSELGGENGDISGDISAAITFAIHQYAKDLHADENNIITIRKVARAYSPWSSKIYQIRQSPR